MLKSRVNKCILSKRLKALRLYQLRKVTPVMSSSKAILYLLHRPGGRQVAILVVKHSTTVA